QYIIDKNGLINNNDSIIFFHYRTDRMYQLIKRILQEEFQNQTLTTMIQISEEFENVNVAFPRLEVSNTMSEVISKAGLKQLHITETEKFPHLTFFLNGEKESEMIGEEWQMIESNRFIKPYYNVEPSMQNFKIAEHVINAIQSDSYDFIIINFSSADM